VVRQSASQVNQSRHLLRKNKQKNAKSECAVRIADIDPALSQRSISFTAFKKPSEWRAFYIVSKDEKPILQL